MNPISITNNDKSPLWIGNWNKLARVLWYQISSEIENLEFDWGIRDQFEQAISYYSRRTIVLQWFTLEFQPRAPDLGLLFQFLHLLHEARPEYLPQEEEVPDSRKWAHDGNQPHQVEGYLD